MAAYILSQDAISALVHVETHLADVHCIHKDTLSRISLTGILAHEDLATVRLVVAKKDIYNVSLLDILKDAKPCIPALQSVVGKKSSTTTSEEHQLEISKKKRREYLQKQQEAREYNKMVFGTEKDPAAEAKLEGAKGFSSFKNQISISLNMIVSVFACFGIGYYICLKMGYDEKKSLIVGLLAAVLIMFIEMLLFIFRAVRVEHVETTLGSSTLSSSLAPSLSSSSSSSSSTTLASSPSSTSVSGGGDADELTKKKQ